MGSVTETITRTPNPRKLTPQSPGQAVRVLLVSHQWDIACDLPQVFVAAGVEVDVLCPAGNCAMKGGFYDGWWDSGPSQETLFQRLYALWQTQRYAKIILCDDPLLWRIAYGPIEELKPLLPIQDPAIGIMHKAGLATFCQQHGLPTPPCAALNAAQDVDAVAEQVGFPLLIKPNLSNGGQGIVVCATPSDYRAYWQSQPFNGQGYLIQRFIQGKHLSVEPLYHRGELLEYACSDVHAGGLGPTTRRVYLDKTPALTQLLQHFGRASGIDGFVNMGFILSDDNRYWLFEADPRPNRWIAVGKWFGADFSQVIRPWLFDPPQARDLSTPATPLKDPVIEVMPMYTQELINQGRLVDALLHLTNFDHTWRYLLDDPVQLEGRLRALHTALLAATKPRN